MGHWVSEEAQQGKMNSNVIKTTVVALSPFSKGMGGTHLSVLRTLTDTLLKVLHWAPLLSVTRLQVQKVLSHPW